MNLVLKLENVMPIMIAFQKLLSYLFEKIFCEPWTAMSFKIYIWKESLQNHNCELWTSNNSTIVIIVLTVCSKILSYLFQKLFCEQLSGYAIKDLDLKIFKLKLWTVNLKSLFNSHACLYWEFKNFCPRFSKKTFVNSKHSSKA